MTSSARPTGTVIPTARANPELHAFIQKVIDGIQLRNFRYPVRWTLTNPDVTPMAVTMTATVLERDSGRETLVLLHNTVLESWEREDARGIAAKLQGMLRTFLRHEADEAFHLDGVRIFDPHA